MTTREEKDYPRMSGAAAVVDVLQTIPKAKRSYDTFLVRLLLPIFRQLPKDVQARLARDTMLSLAAAHVLAKERLGKMGNVRLDGDTCQIGRVTPAGDFEVLAHGPSWEAAWEALTSLEAAE